MAQRLRSLPRVIRPGGGRKIFIHLVPSDDPHFTPGGVAEGQEEYDTKKQIAHIWIDKNKTPRQQWLIYWHEMVHVMLEIYGDEKH